MLRNVKQLLDSNEMVEGMTGQQIVITKLSTNVVILLGLARCHRVRGRGGGEYPKEGTATMHKESVQS